MTSKVYPKASILSPLFFKFDMGSNVLGVEGVDIGHPAAPKVRVLSSTNSTRFNNLNPS
ncbi:MAG: hypothetical protein IKZ53_02300 [Selenomonadaceae bacterium]|nr:hypothetical protein [Selenomonadaceae bacterium]